MSRLVGDDGLGGRGGDGAARGPVRAVVFDFDGVIVESGDIKTEAFVELFAEEHPQHIDAIRRHHLDNLGVSRFKKFAWIYHHLLGAPLDDGERIRLGDRFAALVFDKVCAAPYVPGAREALDALAARGLPLAVASGTPQDELDRVVDARGLRRLFLEVHGSPTEKVTAIRSFAARLDVPPGDVLMIGDGTTDHAAALAAGTRFVARRTPDVAAHWRSVGCECLDDLRGLPALIERSSTHGPPDRADRAATADADDDADADGAAPATPRQREPSPP